MTISSLLSAYFEAWTYFGHLPFMLSIIGGVFAGVLIGVIPGLGAAIIMAIFLPFVFLMSPDVAMPFMVTVHTVAFTGGTVTTILMAIPGTSSNAATLMDGYPMTQKGEAGRALGIAITASGMGCVWSMVFALLTIPLVIPLVLAIASPEMIFMVLLGICLIATLSKGSTVKGVISGLMGIIISLVGYHLVTGDVRFTFGSIYLRDQLPIVPVFIGLFAVPEMVKLASTGSSIAKADLAHVSGLKSMLGGIKEVFQHLKLNIFSSLIGYVIGIIPGIGGLVASWVSYGQAKQLSKNSDKFGTGIAEGIIAPESANNSSAGGSLLTSVAFGIPGSEGCVLLLAALMMLGIIPGPEMMKHQLPFTISLMLVVAVAGVLASILCLLAAPQLAKLAGTPGHILVPPMLVLVSAGVYVGRELYADLITLFVFGLLGLLMRVYGYDRPVFVLGFVLGSLFEKYLFLSIAAWGPLFFLRPICLVLIVIIILSMSFGTLRSIFLITKK